MLSESFINSKILNFKQHRDLSNSPDFQIMKGDVFRKSFAGYLNTSSLKIESLV